MGFIVIGVAVWATIAVGIAVASVLYPGRPGRAASFGGLIDWRL